MCFCLGVVEATLCTCFKSFCGFEPLRETDAAADQWWSGGGDWSWWWHQDGWTWGENDGWVHEKTKEEGGSETKHDEDPALVLAHEMEKSFGKHVGLVQGWE